MALPQRLIVPHLFQSLRGSPTAANQYFTFFRWTRSPLLPSRILLPAISISIPSLISDIWEGILKAVPKKKTSHMKKRHRQLAGKALKDVNAINNCPGCGKPKKAHTLCPYCVAEIKESWKQAAKDSAAHPA